MEKWFKIWLFFEVSSYDFMHFGSDVIKGDDSDGLIIKKQ
jgi:hypothetical protein